MSEHTLPLWRVIELKGDAGDGLKIGLGPNDYPIFDETQRVPLNRKIIDHFWLREIGAETVSQFTFFLGRTMREQMPMYNQLYLTTRIQFDPLSTYNLSTVRDGTAAENTSSSTTSHNTSDTTSKSRSVSSDTPQTMLAGNEDYASSASDANSLGHVAADGTGSGTMTGNTTQTDTSTTKGYQGSASRLLTEYRNTILNIDMNVISELNDCFLGVWDSPPQLSRPSLMGALRATGIGYY